MSEHKVATTDQIKEGERLVTEIKGREIGVFRINGDYKAYLNWCLHQCGPCCEGQVSGTTDASFDPASLELRVDWVKDGEILHCPWHGWEYDLLTGKSLSKEGVELPSYPVRVENEEIIVSL